MSTEDNKALFPRWCEVISQNRLDSVEEITATEEVDHACRQASRLEDVKQIFTPLQIASPDAQIEIQDLIAEGDKVVGRVTARGTHEGEFMGIAPTGKPLGFTAIDIVRIAGCQIAERWSRGG
jgi:predicted ester cyclase